MTKKKKKPRKQPNGVANGNTASSHASDSLKLARFQSLEPIPRYLFEQVKDRTWSVDSLYTWGRLIAGQPDQLIYAMVTPKHEIKGILWATVAPMIDGIFINTVSVNPEYQDGIILKKITGFLKEILKELGLSNLYGLTLRAKAMQRLGWQDAGYMLVKTGVDEEKDATETATAA